MDHESQSGGESSNTPDLELVAEMRAGIDEIWDRYLPGTLYMTLGLSLPQIQVVLNGVYSLVFDDLQEYLRKDPAAKSDRLVLRTYTGFKAVMTYRIANALYYLEDIQQAFIRESHARRMSEDAKKLTGIDIHPAARIGPGFVVDHGVGTVVGETCEIGARCSLLQCVILGSRDTVHPQTGKRHPTLGDNVSIGGFASIFGAVRIGDNVSIGPRCIVTEDVKSGNRVTRVNELQITRGPLHEKVKIFGVVPNSDTVTVYGDNFSVIGKVSLVDAKGNRHMLCSANILQHDDATIVIRLERASPDTNLTSAESATNVAKLEFRTENSTLTFESIGLRVALETLFSNGEQI